LYKGTKERNPHAPNIFFIIKLKRFQLMTGNIIDPERTKIAKKLSSEITRILLVSALPSVLSFPRALSILQ
jgi:hypothetical protein